MYKLKLDIFTHFNVTMYLYSVYIRSGAGWLAGCVHKRMVLENGKKNCENNIINLPNQQVMRGKNLLTLLYLLRMWSYLTRKQQLLYDLYVYCAFWCSYKRTSPCWQLFRIYLTRFNNELHFSSLPKQFYIIYIFMLNSFVRSELTMIRNLIAS